MYFIIKKINDELVIRPYIEGSTGFFYDLKDDLEDGIIFRKEIKAQNGQLWEDNEAILIKGDIIEMQDVLKKYLEYCRYRDKKEK